MFIIDIVRIICRLIFLSIKVIINYIIKYKFYWLGLCFLGKERIFFYYLLDF